MNRNYLFDYSKFEYILICYFRKIQIVQNFQDLIPIDEHRITPQSLRRPSGKYLLHVIDLNQSSKFFSNQAFKRFKLNQPNLFNGDIQALKDLVLLDLKIDVILVVLIILIIILD